MTSPAAPKKVMFVTTPRFKGLAKISFTSLPALFSIANLLPRQESFIISLMPDEDREDSEYQPCWYELITLQEAAKLSGLSSSHIRLLASSGEIWAKKLGANWFTTEQAVKDYLARDRRPGPKPKDQT